MAGDDVPDDMGVRPWPYMVYQNMRLLKVKNVESVVKVDDTIGGIGEGLNAGCWTIGLSNWSNYTDVDSLEQWDEMAVNEQEERVNRAGRKLRAAGAHYVCIRGIVTVPLSLYIYILLNIYSLCMGSLFMYHFINLS